MTTTLKLIKHFFSCLVEKEWTCSGILHHSIFGHDLVFFIVHSICPRLGKENRFYLYWIESKQRHFHPFTRFVFPLILYSLTSITCVFFIYVCLPITYPVPIWVSKFFFACIWLQVFARLCQK